MVVLWGGAVPDERGTPVLPQTLNWNPPSVFSVSFFFVTLGTDPRRLLDLEFSEPSLNLHRFRISAETFPTNQL